MTPAALSALILVGALILFVSERVRHDLVALIALFACLATGLVSPATAFAGFADPAVLAVAAILVVGRAIELSGAASAIAQVAIPSRASFTARLFALLGVAMLLSAFMNNIAALVITMPVATEIARSARKPPAATLMPLAFASILGGMTTLIGTPANLILSSVRESELGAPLGFFTMTPPGVAVALLGLLYLGLFGWRMLPIRESAEHRARPPWRVFELALPSAAIDMSDLRAQLRRAGARLLARFRGDTLEAVGPDLDPQQGDRLLIVSRASQRTVAEAVGLDAGAHADAPGTVTARVVVAHGSFLVDSSYDTVRGRSEERLEVVAVGPRAARERRLLATQRIRAGDQLYLRGQTDDLARFLTSARLLEIDRLDPVPVLRGKAAAILTIFALSIAAIVFAGISPSLAFLAAAVLIAGSRLLPADEIYRSIDWSVIVLLAAMIPVGHSFEDSGAAGIAAQWLGTTLAGLPLFVMLAALCSTTLLLSIFLNNVATAIIMGPLAIDAAHLLGIPPDAALLAVLIGASSDFLTPIGHQNNLLVMGPGGYRFTDYARMGGILVLLVVLASSLVLAAIYAQR